MLYGWNVSRKTIYWIVAVFAVLAICYRIMAPTKRAEKTCFGTINTNWARQCISNQLLAPHGTSESQWIPAVTRCGQFIKDSLEIAYLENVNDVKLFVPFSSDAAAATCVGATLGVGNDTVAEEKLLQRHKMCRLFGADPVYETGEPFEKVGSYFPIGVGGEAGMANSLVLINGEYKYAMMNLTTVDTFLTLTGEKFFDFFWFDCEGAEYGVLPQLMERNDVTICQMNIEFHFIGKNRETFKQMISMLLERSPFIPLWASCVKGHYRMYFVNTANPNCCRRFTMKN